ncbi:MAG: glycoside hydrolase family 3 N-terminal domain-containing protein [Bacteroidota bacterium]
MIFPLIFILFVGCQDFNRSSSDDGVEAKVDSVLSEMTLEEKIGQLTLYTSDFDQTGPTVREGYKEDIQKGRVGAVFNAYGAEFNRELQEMAVEETRLGIPLLFGYDVIHGHKTIFPIPLGETASWDPELMQETGRVAALEASAQGLHWTFAPMIDVSRDARWGRIAESAGEDTYLNTVVARAKVRGFQGDDLDSPSTILSTAKHFAGYGAAKAGRDYHTVDISERTLREVYLPPFEATVEEGVGSFMTAFNEIGGVPATGSEYLFTDILRDEWGFDGFVVSDYTAINELMPHGVAADSAEAGALAINAGVDMDMQGAIYHKHLPELVEEGIVSEETVDEAVRRILRYKFKLGLFDDPYKYSDEEREEEIVLNEDHMELARETARESMVLLKNEDETLPLSKDIGSLAVIGPLADNQEHLIGSWSAAGETSDAVTLMDGIEEVASSQTQINYAKGVEIESEDKSGFSEAVQAANQSDAVILAIGEEKLMSGEAASRSEIDLPGVQQDLIREIKKTGKPVVLVLMNGRPLDLTWEDENVPAILETWFAGTQAGPAIADILFGDDNPSGKLPVTFPRSVGQIPIHYDMKNTGRPKSDNKYTSKYLDVPNSPLYPFGYGLSYTTFEYSDIALDKSELSGTDSLQATVEVSNTGDREGEEVVQLYIRDMNASVTRPVKELKAFEKISLDAGETKEISFTIDRTDLEFYDIDMNLTAEPGEFKVFIGTNSEDVQEAEFEYRDE